jgi:hypothetical protein
MAEKFAPHVWNAPRGHLDNGPYDYQYRTCSFCGSIHPEDLLNALEAGASVEEADRKYGYPHKFYIDLPNSIAGQEVEVGSVSDASGRRPTMGTAPAKVPAKFYSVHIFDDGVSPENLQRILDLLHKATGVRMEIADFEKMQMNWRMETASMQL